MQHSNTARDDDRSYEDRRSTPRVQVALPAFLQADGKRHAVQIIDLSSGGAKLDSGTGFASGTIVLLDCGSLACSAVVRWQTGRLIGLSFEAELAAREVSALMDRSNALAALMKRRR